MVTLKIDADGYELSPELRGRIEDTFGALDRYLKPLDRGHVTVSSVAGTNESTAVRAQILGGGHHFEAADTDRDAITATDRTHHRLETQIRREHGKEIAAGDRR